MAGSIKFSTLSLLIVAGAPYLKLLYNGGNTLGSLSLKGEHRGVSLAAALARWYCVVLLLATYVERSETSAVFVEGLEIELHELLWIEY